jgi:hypothetical protein
VSVGIHHKNCGPTQLPGAKSIKSSVGLFQGERFRVRFHRNARRKLEKFVSVATGQVRD